MGEGKERKINLYDYFGFPDLQQRDEARKVFDMEKLLLRTITDTDILFSDTFFEQYHAWSMHINNFRSRLGLHLLLLHYHYKQMPLDMIDVKKMPSPEGAHKIFFDTFAEDSSLYLISYFDKHLEMFSDLFDLGKGERRPLSRSKKIYKMKQVEELHALGVAYKAVTESQAFAVVKEIRDNFAHNKSSTYYGMDVKRLVGGIYASCNNKGISTQETYNAMCELISNYEQLCGTVNDYIEKRISEAN